MADPISSINNSPSNSCVDDDGEASAAVTPPPSNTAPQAANQSLPESAICSTTPAGVQGLVDKFSPPTLSKSVALSTPPSASTAPSASTPASSSRHWFTTSAGAVPGGSYRVSASVMTDEAKTGLLAGSHAEMGQVLVQYGNDKDVQLTGMRETLQINRGGYGLSVTADAGALRANLGENNDDGSLGGNLGAGVELVGVEGTLSTPAGSLTFGQSVSASVGGSMGVRDADHDGKLEFCAKFSVPLYTIGACVEQFW